MNGRGRPPTPDILTPREWEVLALLRRGLSNREIADELGISLAGAKFHVSEIISKLGVSSREEAAAWQPGSDRGFAFGLLGVLSRTRHPFGTKVALVAAAGLIVVSVLLAVVALTLTRSASTSTTPPTDAALQAVMDGQLPPSEERYESLYGRVSSIDGDVLMLADGEGDKEVQLDAATIVARPVGHTWSVDRDHSRLRIGDDVTIAGHPQPDSSLLAVVVSANIYVTHDGIITAIAADHFDVRMRKDRLSTQYNDEPTRIWLAPDVTFEQAGTTMQPGSSNDLAVGRWVSFQGFHADNGDWVALYVYPTSRSGP